jgi:ribonuclease D
MEHLFQTKNEKYFRFSVLACATRNKLIQRNGKMPLSSSASRSASSRFSSSISLRPRRGGISRSKIRAIAHKSDAVVKRVVRQRKAKALRRRRRPNRIVVDLSISASRSSSRSRSTSKRRIVKKTQPARKKKQLDLAALGRQRRRENVLLIGKRVGRKAPNMSARFAFQRQKAIGLDGNKWIKKGNRWVRF